MQRQTSGIAFQELLVIRLANVLRRIFLHDVGIGLPNAGGRPFVKRRTGKRVTARRRTDGDIATTRSAAQLFQGKRTKARIHHAEVVHPAPEAKLDVLAVA